MILLLQTQKFKAKSLWVFRKKETFACAIFGKICYVVWAINPTGKRVGLRACLHERNHVVVTDKPESIFMMNLHRKRFNGLKTLVND